MHLSAGCDYALNDKTTLALNKQMYIRKWETRNDESGTCNFLDFIK